MNRVQHCGIDHPIPFYSLADGEAVRNRLDRYLDKKMAEWAATVPYASHLEGSKLDSQWYRRHTIEHVWRIRLSRSARQGSPRDHEDLSRGRAAVCGIPGRGNESRHAVQARLQGTRRNRRGVVRDRAIPRDEAAAGVFYFIAEHEHPIGVVASSYLVEYTTAKLTPRQIKSMKETLGEDKIKGQLAHINTDVGDDHAGEMWRILRYLIREEADVDKVLRYFDDIQTILALYFRELFEATVGHRAAA
jgi:hypothetical protein